MIKAFSPRIGGRHYTQSTQGSPMRNITPKELVSRLGGRASAALGIPLARDDDAALGRWFVAACLLGAGEARAATALRELAVRGVSAPEALARADTASVAEALEAARIAKPTAGATKLVRAGAALRTHYAGSLSRLAQQADGFEELGARIAALAPGVGPATVLRFLRELREVWPLADETPLTPAARAAAVHLGWLRDGEDAEGAPGALRAALDAEPEGVPLPDVEAALHRLGARACLRRRSDRCPLRDAGCPAGSDTPDASGGRVLGA
jgi:hypothetical protein